MPSIPIPPVKIKVFGQVTQPADMVEAARKSLTPMGFEELMRRTDHRPTAADVCAAADKERT